MDDLLASVAQSRRRTAGICRRKVEAGKTKTKERALIRECREELAVTLSVGKMFADVVHVCPALTVCLTLSPLL